MDIHNHNRLELNCAQLLIWMGTKTALSHIHMHFYHAAIFSIKRLQQQDKQKENAFAGVLFK